MTFKRSFPHQNIDKTPLFNEVRGMMSKFTVKASVPTVQLRPGWFSSHQKKSFRICGLRAKYTPED